MMEITKTIAIEDLVRQLPDAVIYLAQKGIRCIRCGEPIWGTLEEAAREKGFNDEEIRNFVDDLKKITDQNNISAS